MIWDLSLLIQKQKKLDQKIFEKANSSYSKTIKKRKLALIVELCELANELRFFKFWSKKKSSSKKIVLEEFSDVLHFALTFVIQYNAKNLYEIICDKKKLTTDELSQYFIDLINYINKIKNKNNIEFFLTQLLKLSIYLNFSKNDVFKSYYNKSKINIERSNSNY